VQRLKAKPNQKYGKYTAVKTESGCHDCAAEHDPALCNEMPICSDSDNSVIFKTDNQ
jgi:hypothetical protein